MSATVARMTKDELQEMIGAVVEQKLVELFGDPDEGLHLKKTLQNRLVRQKAAVARGQRGERFEDVAKRLDQVARVVRSNIAGVFAACVLSLGARVAVAGDLAVAPVTKPNHENVEMWLDRAGQYSASLSEPQLVEVLPPLFEPMAAANKNEAMDRLVATIKDPKRRADLGYAICSALVKAGRYDAAIRRAQLLPTEPRTGVLGKHVNSWRAEALGDVAFAQSSNYDFANAKKTIGLIGDPQTVSSAYLWLAENQAEAGLYAEAENSLDKVIATTEGDKEWKEQSRQLIARYKAARRTDPPRKTRWAYYELLRYADIPFLHLGVEFHNLAQAETAEKAADKLDWVVIRAIAWRQIAWTYYDMRKTDKKYLDRCRRAIEKSLENAEKIPNHGTECYERALAFAAAANLYLELMENRLATQATEKAGAANFDEQTLPEISDGCTQMLIAVLVRVGNIDGGREIAEKVQNLLKTAAKKGQVGVISSADAGWLAWATACALEGKAASVERQLEKTSDARTKVVLCTGVATGLLELQQRPVSKKP